ncbi:MAG: hypothetical protein LBL62_11440 [Planctomycetaceae bacterium]|nr:hypothetical protein [Planctomycetaceae bacterium]
MGDPPAGRSRRLVGLSLIPVGLPSIYHIFYRNNTQRRGIACLESMKTQPARPPSGRIAHLILFV